MPFIGARWCEFAQLVADHVLGNKYRDMLPTVVDSDCVADHIGRDCRPATPCFEEFLFTGGVHRVNLLHQMVIHKESFFETACHGSIFCLHAI